MAMEDDGCARYRDDEEEEREGGVLGGSHLGAVDRGFLERPLLGVLLPPHLADDGLLLDNLVDDGMKFELGSSSYGNLRIEEVEEEWEPRKGMEFDSEEAARLFYNSYARRVGFSIRVGIYCRSKRDGAIISRRFVCSKENEYDQHREIKTASSYHSRRLQSHDTGEEAGLFREVGCV